MEGILFIGRERKLGIHKRGRKVQTSRGRPLNVGWRTPNGRAWPYLYPTTSNLFFLEVSSIRSFSSILGKSSTRGLAWVFISKLAMEALG